MDTREDFKKPTSYVGETSKKSENLNPELRNLNNSLMNNTTFNNKRKLNALSVRSHRTSKKKKGINETCCNDTIYKLDNPSDVKKDNSKEPANTIGILNSKPNFQSKNPTDVSKSKNTQNDKNATIVRSQSPKSNKKSKSKSKAEKSNSVYNPKSNTEPQNKKIATKQKSHKLNETQVEKPVKNDHKEKANRENQQNKPKSPKSKTKSKHQNEKESKKNKSVLQPTNLNHTIEPAKNKAISRTKQSNKNKAVFQPANTNFNKTVEPVQNISLISGRPMRSCRTPSQNRSQLNNSSMDMNKSLRSRVINLSSSIENIKIKPKNKNNKNILQMTMQNSDISFSLGSREQTPVTKKTSGRSRADQRKRKT